MTIEQDSLPDRFAIRRETRIKILCDWHEDALDLFDKIKAQISVHNLIEDHDEESYEWADRAKLKAAYAGTALRRIERRMIELGLDLPLTVDRHERNRIRFLEGLANFLQRLCDDHGIEHGSTPIRIKKNEA
jgi:hypothetical protein